MFPEGIILAEISNPVVAHEIRAMISTERQKLLKKALENVSTLRHKHSAKQGLPLTPCEYETLPPDQMACL